MIRTAGILTGSAIAISLLLVLLGIPEFLPESLESPAPPAVTPAEAPAAVAIAEQASAPVNPAAEAPGPSPLETAPEPVATVVTAPQPEAEPGSDEVDLATGEPAEETAAAQPAAEKWYAFWSPFRSELAANGFVATLQRNTGMDYRVVQLKPGVYEVAFAYRDDADIPRNLATIAAATGLEFPGG